MKPSFTMRDSLSALLFDDKETTQSARMLDGILVVIMLSLTLAECLDLVVLPVHALRWLAIIVAVDGLGFALLNLNQRGQTRLAGILLVLGLSLIATVCAATAGGIHGSAVTYYLTIVVIGGLLLGGRGAVLAAAVCCVCGLALVGAEMKGVLPQGVLRPNALTLWLGIVVNMAIIIGLQYLAARAARNALQHARKELTERKQTEVHLQKSEEQLRALSVRLESLREEERTRIAREIHDHLGQLLTALKLDLHSIQHRISTMGESQLCAALSSRTAMAMELADETIQSVQKIASELRPAVLDRLGLATALESEAQSFQSRTGIRCECSVPAAPMKLSADQATAVFRIFQEILTNITRHARASRVSVCLSSQENDLALEVADNGIGITDTDIADSKSLGILGMRERATMLGGGITFERNSGRGTVVTVTIPLNAEPGQTR